MLWYLLRIQGKANLRASLQTLFPLGFFLFGPLYPGYKNIRSWWSDIGTCLLVLPLFYPFYVLNLFPQLQLLYP
jgi:hypothetical protein